MTIINNSTLRLISFLGIGSAVMLSGNLTAQDTRFLQKAFQSCIDHPKVKPTLTAVAFEEKEVLVIKVNDLTPYDLKLMVFGEEATILHEKDMFFLGLEDYVTLNEVNTNQDKIELTLSSGTQFQCTYSSKKGKGIT